MRVEWKWHGIMSPRANPPPRTALETLRLVFAEQKRHHEEFRQFAYAVSHDLREPFA